MESNLIRTAALLSVLWTFGIKLYADTFLGVPPEPVVGRVGSEFRSKGFSSFGRTDGGAWKRNGK